MKCNPTEADEKYHMYNLGWGPTNSLFLVVWGDNRNGDADYYILQTKSEEIRVDLEEVYFGNIHEFYFGDDPLDTSALAYFYTEDGTQVTYTG